MRERRKVARREASKDSKELFIDEVVNHTGEPQKQGTVMFECILTFIFSNLRIANSLKLFRTI